MSLRIRNVLMFLLLGFTCLAATGCNTIHGAGQDIEKAGEEIQEAADEVKN